MAKISSTLELIDRSTAAIEKNINNINKLTNAMKNANNAADVDIAAPIQAAGRAAEKAEDSVNKFGRGLEDLDTNVPQRLTSGFGGLSKAIIVTNQGIQLLQQGYQELGNVMSKVDDRTSADARLSLIKDELHTQEQLENQIMAVANASGAYYETTAALVASIGRQDYFKEQNDKATRFADIINKGFVVSGASTQETNGAIRQLNQAMASGVFRGDEFNSVMEGAPILMEMMSNQIGITKGEMREIAADGKLTADVVGNAILASGQSVDEMFEEMPTTFGRSIAVINNHISALTDRLSEPGQAFDLIIQKVQKLISWLDTADGMTFMMNMAAAINIVIGALLWLFNLFVGIYNFISSNWAIIEPIFIGIATAIGILAVATFGYNAAVGITNLLELIGASIKAAKTGATLADTSATAVATAAQYGFNAALLACPITWILLIIIAVIVVIYAIIGAINKLTGSTMSATGIIAGTIATAIAFIYNNFLALLDLVLGIVNYWINAFSTFVNFFANVFKNPISSVIYLFQGLADSALGFIEKIASAMDYVFGSKMADTVAGWRESLKAMADDAVSKYAPNENYEKVMGESNLSAENLGLKRWDYTDAYKQGYDFGEGIENKVGDLFNGNAINDLITGSGYDGSTPVNAYVTGGGLDKEVDISNQSLEYLNDIAENKALRQFDAISAQMEVISDDSKLSKADKEILMNAAGATTRVYYLSYEGGVNMSNSINKGENWEDIKQKLKNETQSEIDTGISDLEEVVFS